jgi:hypothetical protein
MKQAYSHKPPITMTQQHPFLWLSIWAMWKRDVKKKPMVKTRFHSQEG